MPAQRYRTARLLRVGRARSWAGRPGSVLPGGRVGAGVFDDPEDQMIEHLPKAAGGG